MKNHFITFSVFSDVCCSKVTTSIFMNVSIKIVIKPSFFLQFLFVYK